MKPEPLETIEDVLLFMENNGMGDAADRVRVLWAEKSREAQTARDDAAFLIRQKMKESQLRSASACWMDCEGVS